jgi:hypothetical protein
MPDLSFLAPAIDWIESHEKTVDLLKWAALLLVAWAVGLFKFTRQKLRRPTATLEEVTSRCLVEELSEFQGRRDAVRASFLVEVGLLNPTSEPVVVRYFSLAVPRRKLWRCWKPELIALSLPNRPRHQMGSGEKLIKNWFSNFPDEFRDLTLSGMVEPKHHHSGVLLFVCFAYGTLVPRIDGDFIRVKAFVHLTTGETCKVSGKVRITRDKEKFEQWVPGIVAQVSHESAWGAVR